MEMRAPAVDLFEEKDDIVVKAELPGMDKDNIEVNLTDNLLTIKGEKKKEEEIKEENYYRSERAYGSFVRNIELPKAVQEKVERGERGLKSGRGFLATSAEKTSDVALYRDEAYAALSALLRDLGPAPVEY